MEHEHEKGNHSGLKLASFSDRVVAFVIDMGLFTAGYFLTLKLFFGAYPVMANPNSETMLWLWTGLFLVYQGYFSSEGRVSLGKKVVGIRIVTEDRDPLSVPAGAARAFTYLVSSILNIGFLWSLFHPKKRCWHDLLVGSLVVEDRHRSPAAMVLIRAGACSYLLLMGGMWCFNNYVADDYRRVMDVSYAKVGMQEIAKLEELHLIVHGEYTDNLSSLAQLSGAPGAFLRDMATLFDPNKGIDIETSTESFNIRAYARDVKGTLIAFNGP